MAALVYVWRTAFAPYFKIFYKYKFLSAIKSSVRRLCYQSLLEVETGLCQPMMDERDILCAGRQPMADEETVLSFSPDSFLRFDKLSHSMEKNFFLQYKSFKKG
jgi:hypothetical protein